MEVSGNLKEYKPGIFHYTVSLGPDPERPGKYKQKKFTIHSEGSKDLEKQIAAIQLDLDRLSRENREITVEKYLGRWIEDCHKRKLGRRTIEEYEKIIKNHINPKIGLIKLTQLTPRQTRELIETKMEKSQFTAKKVYIILNSALKQAMADDDLGLKENVCARITPPKLKKVKQKFWNADQSIKFLDTVKENRYYGIFLCSLTTGMRIGEVLGLRWQDVDPENKIINVCQKLEKKPKGKGLPPVFGAPKTEASSAQLIMTDILLDEIKRIQIRQETEKKAHDEAKKEYRDYGLIFTSNDGDPVELKSLYKWAFVNNINKFNKRIDEDESIQAEDKEKLKIPLIRIHDMRHSAATILIKLGVPLKIVQRYLRHANYSTTEIYVHDNDVEILKEAAEKMNKALSKSLN